MLQKYEIEIPNFKTSRIVVCKMLSKKTKGNGHQQGSVTA